MSEEKRKVSPAVNYPMLFPHIVKMSRITLNIYGELYIVEFTSLGR